MSKEVPWFLPMPPGEQFVLPDKGEYGYHRCSKTIHIFEHRPGYCKCAQRFWPAVGTKSRIMVPGEALQQSR